MRIHISRPILNCRKFRDVVENIVQRIIDLGIISHLIILLELAMNVASKSLLLTIEVMERTDRL